MLLGIALTLYVAALCIPVATDVLYGSPLYKAKHLWPKLVGWTAIISAVPLGVLVLYSLMQAAPDTSVPSITLMGVAMTMQVGVFATRFLFGKLQRTSSVLLLSSAILVILAG